MRLFGTCVFLLLATLSYAQDAWRPGRIIRANGDTVKGGISYYTWIKSPTSVKFRYGEVETLTVENAIGFIVDDPYEVYLKKTATVAHYSRSPVPVMEGTNPIEKTVSITCFFERIYVNKNIALFRMTDDDSHERYFFERDGRLTELRDISYYTGTYKGSKVYHIEKPMYRSELKELLKDCDDIDTDELLYSRKAIIRVLKKYAECKGDH